MQHRRHGARLLLVASACFAAQTALALDNTDCFACHGDRDQPKFVDETNFIASAHGKLQCTSCHADITEVPHPDGFKAKPVSCAQCHKSQSETYGASVHGLSRAAGKLNAATCKDCHGYHAVLAPSLTTSPLHPTKLATTCGKCHQKEAEDYQRSVHGKALAAGKREAPTCTDCHSEHKIEALRGAPAAKIAQQVCGRCHAAERIATKYDLPADRVTTYFESYHGLAARLGSTRAANCASCHGWHDVLPSSDPASHVNLKNLPQTCGACHPAIGTRLAAGPIRIHASPGAAEGKPWIVNFVARFYITIIILVVGAMLMHNGLDYFAKVRVHVRKAKADGGELRMSVWVRVQHIALLVLFALLAYTGFVHKFPDAAWSWPFHAIPNGTYWRGLIHRIAGWLFITLFVGHLIAILGTRRGRAELRALWWQATDWKMLRGRLAVNLGRRSELPPRARYDYVEKAEYWALMWGSVLMIVTGIMLIFTEAVLRLLPKVWLDVAQVVHFYEAVLATLAIVIWHFYAVIFDPKEYPMNPAWLIGKKPLPALPNDDNANKTASADPPEPRQDVPPNESSPPSCQ